MSAPALISNAMIAPPAALPSVINQMNTKVSAMRLVVCSNMGPKKSTLVPFSATSTVEFAVTSRVAFRFAVEVLFITMMEPSRLVVVFWFHMATEENGTNNQSRWREKTFKFEGLCGEHTLLLIDESVSHSTFSNQEDNGMFFF